MPYKKGEGGRPKGAINRHTRTVKEAFVDAFHIAQTGDKNLEWFAKKYPRDFYALAAKLIPTEIKATLTKVELTIVRTSGNIIEDITPISETSSADGQTL